MKWFALNNAGGEAGPLVLMIAVPTMEEDSFFATRVLSMGSTTAIDKRGRLGKMGFLAIDYHITRRCVIIY